ncbi:uncharacterized protein LAJ45_04794 [Morchella importuna]|uniref:Uncharacterized protein n=1 Tax=Morchella conica CCBAS932 TaxID=1392247 RepID=A0A3N4KFC3_9PEZI|nr:uncharacterized protein LAJ45_04794 [Morchella importuna]KAH8151092.1 hypothetical protein LAJ45_04794 [Morchella importuna]RPB09187.1 hypothetical protein P167DRAFT_577494 [Morchella conica CCBAS932]
MKSKRINPMFGAGITFNDGLAHLRTRLQEDQERIAALEVILARLTADVQAAKRKKEELEEELEEELKEEPKEGTAKKI